MEDKELIDNLVGALYLAIDRAIIKGDELKKLGQGDINRGQFIAVVKRAVEKVEEKYGKSKYYDFTKWD